MSNIEYCMQGKRRKVSLGTYHYSGIEGYLWAEIFKRLPIKSLCRFQSVCKWWNSLISSRFFINLHLAFTSSPIPRYLKPYLHVSDRRRVSRDILHSADLIHKNYTLYRPLDDVEHFKQDFSCPFRADRDVDGVESLTFVDVINGVVCISYTWDIFNDRPPNPSINLTFLWNPTVHKYVALPSLDLPDSSVAIGFGYDSSRNDFKVVMIPILFRTYRVYNVYSDRRGLWETSTGIKLESDWIFIAPYRPVFLNGTIHWIVKSPKPDIPWRWMHSLLMFDCESEEFRRINIPENVHFGLTGPMELFEYAGMLAGLVIQDLRFDLWVMEEHGVSDSWKKLYTLTEYYGVIRCDSSFEKMSPFGPNNPWNKYSCSSRMCLEHTNRVYDETMFLMDHPKARPYTNKEIVPIVTEDPF